MSTGGVALRNHTFRVGEATVLSFAYVICNTRLPHVVLPLSFTIAIYMHFCKNEKSNLHIENRGVNRHSAATKSEVSDSIAFFEGDFFPPGEKLEAFLTRSDMLFGKRLGMRTVMIESNPNQVEKASILNVDERFLSLSDYSKSLL